MALLGESEIARRVQRFMLLGAATLSVLLTWFSGWYWWAWLWGVIPLIVVMLPGIRRLVDESWGLVVGLLVVGLAPPPLRRAWGTYRARWCLSSRPDTKTAPVR